MERKYSNMFGQVLRQVEPEETQLRAELAEAWEEQAERPSKKGKERVLRRAILIAAVVSLLCVTVVAAAVINRSQKTMVLSVSAYEYGLAYNTNKNQGVFEEGGRYYLQLEGEPLDITGKFSDTVPYIYTRYFPESKENSRIPHHVDYVIGGSGDNIRCVIVDFCADEPDAMVGSMAYKMKGCPIWWRTYLYDQNIAGGERWDGYESLRKTFANHISQQEFRWVVDGGEIESQTGRALLTVKGETLDITDKVADRAVCLLTAKGEENIVASYDKSRTTSDSWLHWDSNLYADSFVMGTYDHTVLAFRDGDQLRWAEFIYRPDGSLRYWMPWNCPTADELDWLTDYASAHGFELDWLIQHAYEIRDK